MTKLSLSSYFKQVLSKLDKSIPALSKACIIFSLSIMISACCLTPAERQLNVTLHPQETGMWCWAASGQMVMDYLGHDVSQCNQANNRFNRNDCCNSPVPNTCVNGGWPEFGKYGFTFDKTTNIALDWSDLKEQLSDWPFTCKKRPFAFTWHWPGGGGHMMVANGYIKLGDNRFVHMLDPWSPNIGDDRIITYDYYVSSLGHHTHWNDYYNVTYVGGP